jgi:adenylate cyclase
MNADPYRIEIEPIDGHLVAEFAGLSLADSRQAMVLRETNLPSFIYFPRDDVAMDLLAPIDRQTFCPFKGNARHWRLEATGRTINPAAWSYEEPLEESVQLKDHIGFYASAVDRYVLDGEPTGLRAGIVPAGRHPFTDWLMRQAGSAKSAEDFTAELSRRLRAAGVPVWRLSVGLWTLHPQLAGLSYTWLEDTDRVTQGSMPHGALQHPSYLTSPVRLVAEGLGGVRQRLDVDNPKHRFPVMDWLKEQGATDYVAMPLPFSDGRVQTLTLASRDKAGFTTADLGLLFESSTIISRLYEVFTLRQNTTVLLDTYLGAHTGRLVRNGLTHRGDGEALRAVVWLCDLRGSTQMAERLSRQDYLVLLNDFFEMAAGAVLDRGGEVLKFIGDSVLAIFPLDSEIPEQDEAAALRALCETAHAASLACVKRAKAHTASGKHAAALEVAISVHFDELTYGNVGAPNRLDFTVIGPAVNETSRLSELAKDLHRAVVYSKAVALPLGDKVESLGLHTLRDVAEPREVFSPRGGPNR